MKRNLPLVILLLLGLIAGIFGLRAHGESWDELKLYDYAADSLEAYRLWVQQGTIPVTGDRFENYGPFYVMLTRLIARALASLLPAVQEVDLRHLVYFITYLAGMWAFFQLATRWVSQRAGLGATLLFMSQPVFWGHAFINPKDIPLLAFFLWSVFLGLRMHDALLVQGQETAPESLSQAWAGLTLQKRRLLLGTTLLWLVLLLALFAGTPLVQRWIEDLVRAAASGEAPWIVQLVPRIQRVEPATYIQKFFVLFLRTRAAVVLAATGLLIWLYRRHLRPSLAALGLVLPAAVVLGLTVSIRIFGVWAGVLVALYSLWRSGRRAVPLLAAYALVALAAMYLTWPYLWPDPAGHLLETVRIMAQHPWPGSVLFNGTTYPANDLPASYLPLLLAIQLTEPVWALFLAGAVALLLALRRGEKRDLLWLTLVWLFVPLAAFVLLRPTLYDNFRQVFFILPPVFLLAGLAFDRVRRPLLQTALMGLVALPGLVSIARLHPYEYVYYNRLIGGTAGAVDRFELEYWATSYREAAREVNRTAPPNASVWVDGPAHLFHPFARPDLHIYSPQEPERAEQYQMVVTLARYDLEKTSFPEAPVVYEVRREGAIFAVVRRPE